MNMNLSFYFYTLREPNTARIVVVAVETQNEAQWESSAASIAIPIARADQHALNTLMALFASTAWRASIQSVLLVLLSLSHAQINMHCRHQRLCSLYACCALLPHCIESIEHEVSVANIAFFIKQTDQHAQLTADIKGFVLFSSCVSRQLRERMYFKECTYINTYYHSLQVHSEESAHRLKVSVFALCKFMYNWEHYKQEL